MAWDLYTTGRHKRWRGSGDAWPPEPTRRATLKSNHPRPNGLHHRLASSVCDGIERPEQDRLLQFEGTAVRAACGCKTQCSTQDVKVVLDNVLRRATPPTSLRHRLDKLRMSTSAYGAPMIVDVLAQQGLVVITSHELLDVLPRPQPGGADG